MSGRDELVEDFARFLKANYPCPCPAGSECEGEREEAEALVRTVEARGYRKPRTITTAEEIRELPALTIVVYDDIATGGLLQTYVVPDDGTVMFKDSGEFHLMTFAGDYIDAKDMPLPLTVVYEVGA
jgi:hypothetical protein